MKCAGGWHGVAYAPAPNQGPLSPRGLPLDAPGSPPYPDAAPRANPFARVGEVAIRLCGLAVEPVRGRCLVGARVSSTGMSEGLWGGWVVGSPKRVRKGVRWRPTIFAGGHQSGSVERSDSAVSRSVVR